MKIPPQITHCCREGEGEKSYYTRSALISSSSKPHSAHRRGCFLRLTRTALFSHCWRWGYDRALLDCPHVKGCWTRKALYCHQTARSAFISMWFARRKRLKQQHMAWASFFPNPSGSLSLFSYCNIEMPLTAKKMMVAQGRLLRKRFPFYRFPVSTKHRRTKMMNWNPSLQSKAKWPQNPKAAIQSYFSSCASY